ncbi:MAG: 2TM domain-containing protein [Aggregatilineales bacterium]
MIPFNLLINLLALFILALLLVIVLAVVAGRIAAQRGPRQTEVSYSGDVEAAAARIRGRFNRRARFASHAALFGSYALAVIVFLLDTAFWRAQFGRLPNAGDLTLVLLWGAVFAAHAINGPAGFPWPGLVTLAWGAGIAANWLEVRSQSPARFVALERSAQAQMARRHGPDWDAIADAEDYQRALRAIEKAAKERQEFVTHFAIYAIINRMLWFIWSTTSNPVDFPFPLVVMGFWDIGLASHGASVFFSSAQQQLAREEAIQREVERLAGQTQTVKKKKREGARLALTDDGELVEIVENELHADQRSRAGD